MDAYLRQKTAAAMQFTTVMAMGVAAQPQQSQQPQQQPQQPPQPPPRAPPQMPSRHPQPPPREGNPQPPPPVPQQQQQRAAGAAPRTSASDGGESRLRGLGARVIEGFGEDGEGHGFGTRAERALFSSANEVVDVAVEAMARYAIGTRASKISSAEQRTQTAARFCKVSGPGLRFPTVRVPTSFTIIAHDATGKRQERGGDAFFVLVK